MKTHTTGTPPGEMISLRTQKDFEPRFKRGELVAGHGRQVLAKGQAVPWRKEIVFTRGVVVILPGNAGGPYTVFDQDTFSIVEVKEDHLTHETG